MSQRLSIFSKLIFLTTSISILVIFIGLFVVYPAARKTRELRANVELTQTSLENDYQKTIQLRRSVRQLDDVHAQVKNFQQATIKAGDELTMITRLETLAAQFGIEQTLHVSFTDPHQVSATERKNLASKVGLPYYTFSFLNHGRFTNHLQLLQALDDLPQYLIIDNLKWEQRGDDRQFVSLRFDARVYASIDE